MKAKKLQTLERYTSVARRSKISVEVEQRKRLGAWGKRVLILDGSTLYAYKTKGDGGSVGGWAIGGADIHVRRNDSANRDDGRRILVIARPPAYKLVFAFSTVYEQARMIQALSSSGATVTGLDAIMLLKNLREQQDKERKEQEQKQQEQNGTPPQEKGEKDVVEETLVEEGQDRITEDKAHDHSEKEKQTDVVDNKEEIRETGIIVSNPIYSSTVNLSKQENEDRSRVLSSNTLPNSISTSKDSDSEALSSPYLAVVSPDQDSDDKVNPLPKPPRANVIEGSPRSSSSVPDTESEDKNVDKLEEAAPQQSVLIDGEVKRNSPKLVGNKSHEASTVDKKSEKRSDKLEEEIKLKGNKPIETKTSLYSSSGSDTKELENDSSPNSDTDEIQYPVSTIPEEENQEDVIKDKGNFDCEYVELVSKMRLERGLSIESQSGGPCLDTGSPEVDRKVFGDLPLAKTPSPVHVIDTGKEGNNENNDQNEYTRRREEDTSDNDEKFEQLYRELSSNVRSNGIKKKSSTNDFSESTVNKINEVPVQDETDMKDVEIAAEESHDLTNGLVEDAKTIDIDNSKNTVKPAEKDITPKDTSLQRVSSIIKKKGSPTSLKSKKVQFNLDATTIASEVSPMLTGKSEQEKEFSSWRSSSLRKGKKDLGSPPDSPSKKKKPEGTTTPSLTKKKGIFSNIFSNSSAKKTILNGGQTKEDLSKNDNEKTNKGDTNVKKETITSKDETNNKNDTSTPKSNITNKMDIPSEKVDTDKMQINVDTSMKKDALTTTIDITTKKATPVTKVDTTIKNTPVTSPTNIKRQPTVDLTAPLIIGGLVEMGGSVSGKVSPRRIEVRDGHVLAFMPKASVPTSRLSLTGLSVTPIIGAIHPNSLSLTRASRCMMVIKLTSREEMMKWINVISDEVIKMTPEAQRTGIVLYPSPKREEVTNNKEEEKVTNNQNKAIQPNDANQLKETVKTLPEGHGRAGKNKTSHTNGHAIHVSEMESNKKKTEVTKSPSHINVKNSSNREKDVNGHPNGVEQGEDTSDGWLQRKKSAMEEYEMDKLNRSTNKHNGSKNVRPIKLNDAHLGNIRQSDGLIMDEDYFKEDKQGEKAAKRISKLNIEERWIERNDQNKIQQKENVPVLRRSIGNRAHPPLKRVSGQEIDNSRAKSSAEYEARKLLFINNPPKRDYHANCHPPLERLSNRSRILSASESNLKRFTDQKSTSSLHNLHKFGSELTLSERPTKEISNTIGSGTKDMMSLNISSSIIKHQRKSIPFNELKKTSNVISPSKSVNPSNHHYKRLLSLDPQKIDIIESKKSSSQEQLNASISKFVEEDSQSYDEYETTEINQDPSSNNNLPGISWSVSSTREKFELLCSVSGENKNGNLTTKTPISRKKSARNSVKKRRSIEGGSGRRLNGRRNIRSIQETISNGHSSTSSSPTTSTRLTKSLQLIDNGTVNQTRIMEGDTVTTLDKIQSNFKLQPVRDLRKSFETDVTSSLDSFYTSSSMDSVSDIIPSKNRDEIGSSIEVPTTPVKSLLKRTHNVIRTPTSPCSSPEPGFISSRLINGRPKGNIPEEDKGVVSRSLATETQMNAERDAEVVICWRGPYIAQEAEQAVLSNISNAFLAKRRLLSREVALARIQEKLSALEDTIWDLQASMAKLDNKQQPDFAKSKASNNWKALERSLAAAEEEMTHWTSRLTQTQKEAEQAREKLAAALVTGLSDYNASGEQMKKSQRQRLLRRYTQGTSRKGGDEEDEEEDEEDEENYEGDSAQEMEDSFA